MKIQSLTISMLESSQSPAWSPKAEVLIECSLEITQISSLHPPKAWLVLKSTWNLSKSSKRSRWIMGTHQTYDTTELASFSPKNQKCLSFFPTIFIRSINANPLRNLFRVFTASLNRHGTKKPITTRGKKHACGKQHRKETRLEMGNDLGLILTPKRRRFPNNDQTRSDVDNKKVMFPSEDQMRIDFDNQKKSFQIRIKWGLILTTKKWGFQMRIKWGLILTTKKKEVSKWG